VQTDQALIVVVIIVVAVGHVVADGAAGGRPEQGVVAGEVTGDAADYRAFDAAARLRFAHDAGQETKAHHGRNGLGHIISPVDRADP
jgi:hypothetical protein